MMDARPRRSQSANAMSGWLPGDGEVYSWGDARARKTSRQDMRTTFVPWQVEMPATLTMGSGFLTQLSVGAHHSLALFRTGKSSLAGELQCCMLTTDTSRIVTDGKMDRWRKFPLGRIMSALPVDISSSPSSQTSAVELMRREFGASEDLRQQSGDADVLCCYRCDLHV